MIRRFSIPKIISRQGMVVFAIIMMVVVLVTCTSKSNENVKPLMDATGVAYAGSQSCKGCHADIYNSHIKTAHFRTSAPASPATVLGSFENDKNNYFYNRSVRVSMEARDSGLYQVEYFVEEEKKARRMDMVVGSGAKGQSFLNWREDYLHQLPITWFSAAAAWSNSPGFPDKVLFNRVITSRCMECHSTVAQITSAADIEPETFNPKNLIYGVDCEKCHGAASEHVEFHTANPAEKIGKYIVNTGKLPRQTALDLCASCHGGRLQKTKPSFSFRAGEKLSDYFAWDSAVIPDPTQIDVHGNQYALLRASECFIKSGTMTCGSCHDPHQQERANPALFSARCQSCHQPDHNFCSFTKLPKSELVKNCIDCHMPLQDSKAIAVQMRGDSLPVAARIRTHYVAVYLKESLGFTKK